MAARIASNKRARAPRRPVDADPDRRRPARGRLAALVGQRLLRTFEGTRITPGIAEAILAGRTAGVTLFRYANVESPGQLRDLCASLQAARPAVASPLLLATDQEGGQLQALVGSTAWPGNLALGATGSTLLARRAGEAIGRELAATGVNVAFAPDCDLLLSRLNPALGTRAFGDDPAVVGRFTAAMVRGIQAAGVAATLKHFPGHGSADADSHLGLPAIDGDADCLLGRDLVPYRDGVRARARLVMIAHLAVPEVTGGRAIAATMAPELIGLLREPLAFRGVTVSDALNMRGFGPDASLERNVLRVAAAGVDLLLLAHDHATEERLFRRLLDAATAEILARDALEASAARVRRLRRWLGRAGPPPELDVVDGAAHRRLAREIAERSVTLVRDRQRLLPLRLREENGSHRRLAVIAPRPADLTPADTSSTVRPELAANLRAVAAVDEWTLPLDPSPSDIAALVARARTCALAVVGTMDAVAHPGQAAFVRALLDAGMPVAAVALRTPFDLEAYPEVGTYLCTYGIQPPSIAALVAVLAGRLPARGRLPVTLRTSA